MRKPRPEDSAYERTGFHQMTKDISKKIGK
jgi:hypothetical protein